MTVVIEQADLQLAELFERVEAGDDVLIVREGQPVAHVEAMPVPATPRTPGIDAGKFVVPPEFFEPLPDDLLDEFYK